MGDDPPEDEGGREAQMARKQDDTVKAKLIDLEASEARWREVEWALASDAIHTVYLYGPPGIGKTYAGQKLGRVHRGVSSITVTQETPAYELRGNYMPDADGMSWYDGPAVTAMRCGGRLLLNEVLHGSEDLLALLYVLLESDETCRLTLPTGETVVPAPGYHVVITDNEAPEELPAPLRDRLDCVFELVAPHPDALATLSPRIRRACLRSLALDSDRAVSFRRWSRIDALAPVVGLEQACRLAFGPERGGQLHDALTVADADAA